MIDVQDNGVVVKGNPHKITALHVMYDMKDQGFQDLLKAGGARGRASTLQQHCGPAAVLLPVTNLLKHAAHPTILTVTWSSLLLPEDERCGAVFDGPKTDEMRRDLGFTVGIEEDWRITLVDLNEHAYSSTDNQFACLSLEHKMQRAVDAHNAAAIREVERPLDIKRKLNKEDQERRRVLEYAAQHCRYPPDSEDEEEEQQQQQQAAAAPLLARSFDAEAEAVGGQVPKGAILRSTVDPLPLGGGGVLGGEATDEGILRSTEDPLLLGVGGVLGGEAAEAAMLRLSADPLPLRHDDGTLHWQNTGRGLTPSEDSCDGEAGSAEDNTDDSVGATADEEQTRGEPVLKRPRVDSPWSPLCARLRQGVTDRIFGSFSVKGDAYPLDSV